MVSPALQEAGVDLTAKHAREYLKQLRAVDKAQQQTFLKNMKAQTAATKAYTQQLNQATQAHKRFAQETKKTNTSQRNLLTTLAHLNQSAIPQMIVQLARAGFELSKNAANFNAQQTGMDNLAASYGQSSGDIVAAMNKAAAGTLSSTDIILAANKALLLDVAKTPAEFEKVTESAIILGRTMGLDAPRAIDKFTIALGRKSFPILDDFGIKAAQVNKVMEEMSQAQFGVELKGLDAANKDLLFMQAALKVASDRVAVIGTETGEAAASFDRLNAQTENLKLVLGEAILPSMLRFVELSNEVVVSAQKAIAILGGGVAQIDAMMNAMELPSLGEMLLPGGRVGLIKDLAKSLGSIALDPEKMFDWDAIADEGQAAFDERFKQLARPLGVSFAGDEAGIDASTDAMTANAEAAEQDAKEIDQLGQSIKQAERLYLAFAQAQEDADRRLQRQQAKQGKTQRKERDKLLQQQAEELEDFEADRLDQIADAEEDIRKTKKEAAEQQKNDQQRLHQQLKQAQERFDLSRLQSSRRFQLQDKRLLAAGDVLALQQLREDNALQQKEAEENFNLDQRQTKDSAKTTQQEKAKDLQSRVTDLKNSLDEQRAELLKGFDDEFTQLQEAQAEQRAQTLLSYQESQEDAQINQQRQLEALGRSMAEQKDVTQEGAENVAGELETIFGQDGVASTIMTGFADRTNSEFATLFQSLQKEAEEFSDELAANPIHLPLAGQQRKPLHLPLAGQVPSMHEGGVVPGQVGVERPIMALGGERVFPIGQQQLQSQGTSTAAMGTPAIPTQTLAVEISGGMTIEGGEADPEAVSDAADLITEELTAAIRRLAREN